MNVLKKVLGGAIVSSPFVAIGAFVVAEDGWLVMLGIYGAVVVIIGLMLAGILLITD